MEFEVRGNSMSGIYAHGTTVVASDAPLERGSDVVIKVGDGLVLKRVFGIPGDALYVDDHLHINGSIAVNTEGVPFSVTNGQRSLLSLYILDYAGIIPTDCLVVLGNTQDSSDSRTFGFVHLSDVIGVINSSRTNAESK